MKKRLVVFSVCAVLLFTAVACGKNANNSPSSSWMPTVTGKFGETPKIKFKLNPNYTPSPTPTPKKGDPSHSPEPDSPSDEPDKYIKAPSGLQDIELSKGKGQEVKSGDTIVVNYYGVIWGTDSSFDSSFKRKEASAFVIGKGQVVKGWDQGIVGKKVGSRLLLIIPSELGYGKQGQPSAGISPGDTLVFVIDIIARFKEGAKATKNASITNLKATPKVKGSLGQSPTITIATDAKEPNNLVTTVIAKGKSNTKVKAGDIVLVNYKAVSWNGQVLADSFSSGLYGVAVNAIKKNQSTVFDQTIGLPLNSRILIQTPSRADSYPAYAMVIDVVAVVTKEQAKNGLQGTR